MLGQTGICEISSGYIHGNGKLHAFSAPFHHIFTNCFPYIVIQLGNKAVLLKDGNKHTRIHKSKLRMYPSYQSFRTGNLLCLRIDLRLVIHPELLLLNRFIHALDNQLLHMNLFAHSIIIGSKIFSIYILDGMDGNTCSVTHVLYRNISSACSLINTEFDHQIGNRGLFYQLL